jgi:hypothetical protein
MVIRFVTLDIGPSPPPPKTPAHLGEFGSPLSPAIYPAGMKLYCAGPLFSNSTAYRRG